MNSTLFPLSSHILFIRSFFRFIRARSSSPNVHPRFPTISFPLPFCLSIYLNILSFLAWRSSEARHDPHPEFHVDRVAWNKAPREPGARVA